MHPRPERKLCRLIDDSLRPFTYLKEESSFLLTKENEKHLLIRLSKVFRQIQIWIDESESDLDDDSAVVERPHSSNHDCLTKIIGYLIVLLQIGSQYVQHMAGNILVAISDYFLTCGSEWNELVQVLCICLGLACSNAIRYLNHPSMVTKSPHVDSLEIVIALRPKLEKASWTSVACLFRVLRNILKQGPESQFLEVYMDTIHSCLTNLPWESLDELFVCQNGDTSGVLCSNTFGTNAQKPESRTILSGNLVQLFCSLVKQSGRIEASDESLCKHPVIFEICDLVPRLLGWCLCYEDHNLSIFNYLRHKILVLMVRLSLQSQLKCSVLVLWLQLISKYFEDLLLLPITQQEFNKDDSLEDSPFLLNISDARKCNITSSHLQRLAVFLFLRCSFTLVQLKDRSSGQCGCPNLKVHLHSDIVSGCGHRRKGISELSGWLKRHVSDEVLVGSKFYSEGCAKFSSSFLRLFIQEDDILFTVLLQLFCVPSCTSQQVFEDASDLQELKDNMFSHLSNLLNPVHLFHLFLAELNYDHQVLLDYLISNDTGPSSAEYLLRSLRAVCDSWDMFSEFSVKGKDTEMEDIHVSSCKKRKKVVDGSSFQEHVTTLVKSSGSSLPHGKQCEKDLICGSKHSTIVKKPFEKVADCLFSLKVSLKNLDKKNLFPYSPKVILRRLTRFQELFLEAVK